MGTLASTADEWIELFNPGSLPVNVQGWKLVSGDGSPSILLSGTLPAGGYLLLERTDNDTVKSVVVANAQLYSGDLGNDGESLFLYDDSSHLVDSANGNGGSWPAGETTLRCSMQRKPGTSDSDLAWETASLPANPSLDAAGKPICGSPNNDVLLPTATSTRTPTPTASLTSTPTPTLTVTPTITATPTGTRTVTSTVSATPTTAFVLQSTATATRTALPLGTSTQTVTPTQTLTATLTPTLLPTPLLTLIINEVAWMGTLASSTDEWLELYNPGSLPLNVNGWKLVSSDGSPTISLTGTIPAGGYLLLERTDNETVNSLVVATEQIYSGELGNDGESLFLYDAGSHLVDTANGNGGPWPAGDATLRCSMQRKPGLSDSDLAWETASLPANPSLDAAGKPICGSPSNHVLPATALPTRTPTPARTATPVRTATPRKSATPLPNYATPESVVLNEFLPEPRSDWNLDGKIDSGDEFIEIINLGSQPISLSGWRLDDQEGDSSPYTIKDLTLQPGVKLAFFASQTGLLLGNGGDSVRLFKLTGQLADAYTYGLVEAADQSGCRLPDGGAIWQMGCAVTPGQTNRLTEPISSSRRIEAQVCFSQQLPADLYVAECLRPEAEAGWNETAPLDTPRFLEVGSQEFILE
jgi:hypothetical protein